MISFRIDYADVILQDFGNNKGKIIISDDDWGYNFSYYWGSMGKNLIDFLLGLNSDYFCYKLGPSEKGPINVKKTMSNVRKEIRQELPWYECVEFQKDMRLELKLLESEVYDQNDFVESMYDFPKRLDYNLIDNEFRKRDIVDTIYSIFETEPWNFIVYEEHKQIKYLSNFFPKLKKTLNEYKNLQRDQIQEPESLQNI